MNILTYIKQQLACPRGVFCMASFGMLWGTSTAMAACTSGDDIFLSTTSAVPYEDVSEGDWLTGAGARTSILRNCDATSGADLTIEVPLTYHGEVGGTPTFSTSNSGVGVQVRFKYIQSISGSGDTEWSDWIQLGTRSVDFHAKPNYAKGEPLANLPIEVNVDVIALEDYGSGTYNVSDLSPVVTLSDHSYGLKMPTSEMPGYQIRPKIYASCWFSSQPPSKVTLARTHVSLLKEKDQQGPAVDFSFSWACRGGDDKDDDSGDFMFKSDKKLATTGGRLATDGSAKGVDMLVSMKNGEKYDPIRFDSWAGKLPATGKRDLQVRFIRNADELQPGDATSTMTITVEPY